MSMMEKDANVQYGFQPNMGEFHKVCVQMVSRLGELQNCIQQVEHRMNRGMDRLESQLNTLLGRFSALETAVVACREESRLNTLLIFSSYDSGARGVLDAQSGWHANRAKSLESGGLPLRSADSCSPGSNTIPHNTWKPSDWRSKDPHHDSHDMMDKVWRGKPEFRQRRLTPYFPEDVSSSSSAMALSPSPSARLLDVDGLSARMLDVDGRPALADTSLAPWSKEWPDNLWTSSSSEEDETPKITEPTESPHKAFFGGKKLATHGSANRSAQVIKPTSPHERRAQYSATLLERCARGRREGFHPMR